MVQQRTAVGRDEIQSAVHITKLAVADVDFFEDGICPWPSQKKPPRAIWALGGGELTVIQLDVSQVTFTFPDGALPVQIQGIRSSGSTVSEVQVYW